MKKKKNEKQEKNAFILRARYYVCRLRKENCYSTAHVYESTANSLLRFAADRDIGFDFINRDSLKEYEIYLNEHECMPNTVSTYMRTLRAIYNRCVVDGFAVNTPQLFRDVFTGIESVNKKALGIEDLQTLLTTIVISKNLQQVQIAICLMFQLCGISFADLAHLKKHNIKNGRLEYHRRKSGTPLKLELLATAIEAIAKLSTKGDTKYLFSFLSGTKEGKEAFVEYQSALTKFNRRLKALAKSLGIKGNVTSYSIRHSFATLLKSLNVQIEMISELLGHTSIKTTQIYLKEFAIEEQTKVNQASYDYMRNYVRV